MLPALLTIAAVLLVIVALIFGVGRGSWRRGCWRMIRRIRKVRRRILEPGLRRLRSTLTAAWRRPARRGVATQLRRLADRVDRLGGMAAELVRARGELSRHLSQLHDISPTSPPSGGDSPRKIRKVGAGRDWIVAALLGLVSLAFAAANVWLLTALVLPYLPESFVVGQTMTTPVALSSLAFLLGLAYYALGSLAGLGGRPFRWFAWLLIALLAAAEGFAVVTALQAAGVASLDWWGGIAVATLLGGAGALVPPVIAAIAHGALERLEQWLSGREVREARNVLSRQNEVVEQVRQTLDRLEARVTGVRAELTALAAEGAGPLLLAGDQASVERATLVLRRLSRAVEADPGAPGRDDTGPVKLGLLLVRDLVALGIWLLAAAAALTLTLPAVAELTGDSRWFIPAATVAGIGLLLVMGAILRWILSEVSIEKSTPLRGAMVLLTGLAAVAVGLALGPAVSETRALATGPTEAGSWLALLVLVAAAASARLGSGVTALAAVFTALLAAVAWLVLAMAHLILGVLDVMLAGARSRSGGGRRSDTHGGRSGAEVGSGHLRR